MSGQALSKNASWSLWFMIRLLPLLFAVLLKIQATTSIPVPSDYKVVGLEKYGANGKHLYYDYIFVLRIRRYYLYDFYFNHITLLLVKTPLTT